MLTAETILAALATYLVMLAAFYLSRIRLVHVGTMVAVMLFDLAMPFYLYLNRDWKGRLIDHGEILSFLLWMHIGLLITLYGLYLIQIKTGLNLLSRDQSVRPDHRSQAVGILVVRALVIISGALLFEPEALPQ